MICQICHETEARFERGRGSDRIRLCLNCLTRSGLQHLDGWRLAQEEGSGPRCPTCRLGWNDFARRGRYGCPDCRAAFAERFEAFLHAGERALAAASDWPLEVDLSLALLLEDYELAARLRDQLENKES